MLTSIHLTFNLHSLLSTFIHLLPFFGVANSRCYALIELLGTCTPKSLRIVLFKPRHLFLDLKEEILPGVCVCEGKRRFSNQSLRISFELFGNCYSMSCDVLQINVIRCVGGNVALFKCSDKRLVLFDELALEIVG